MANYAVIENGLIVNAVVAEPEYASQFDNWVLMPDRFGIGDTYDRERNAFVKKRLFNSWILDEQTGFWNPPVPMPEDAGTGDPPKHYFWDEQTLSWIEVSNGS